MDLVAGRVIHRCLPACKRRIRSPRTPLLLSSWAYGCIALAACPCPPIVCRNASAVVPFAKKKRKGGNDEPPDEEADDDFVDETEGENEDDGNDDDVVDDDDLFDEDEDDDEEDDYAFEDDFESDNEQDLYVGDGGAGGGISLAGTWWDKEVLALAEEVSASFDGDLKIYAFKTVANLIIRVRIEKMSTRYGSPTIDDIEAYTIAYRAKLDDAESAGRIPQNISLEVLSL
ncbi:hypothetical protein GUJ93_ZPchr0004g39040 [Zizania palustris]|uniref:Uncharacterized protein n=1 Tax=Zizania palustris TaxID=103762 RepID=A0A8J5VZ02_ZIZPA|nr:hypothetical protein GUJ93_ZPchr0004g39040 [Zizania palustris]